MKIFPYSLLLTLSIISPLSANDTFVMDVSTLKEEALKKTNEIIKDAFELMDIDGNGKLSRRECSGTDQTKALVALPYFSQSEISTLTQKIETAFDTHDIDKDGYLSPTEAKEYISYIENLGLDMQMKKMDPNGDGQITDEEMTALMKTMPSPEESIAKLNEAENRLKKIDQDPEKFTNNFISNITKNINKEEFSEMDQQKDGKVTPDEYVSYMYHHPNNKELDMSQDDYRDIFNLIDKTKKGYITEQEYLDYNENQFNEAMSYTKEK